MTTSGRDDLRPWRPPATTISSHDDPRPDDLGKALLPRPLILIPMATPGHNWRRWYIKYYGAWYEPTPAAGFGSGVRSGPAARDILPVNRLLTFSCHQADLQDTGAP